MAKHHKGDPPAKWVCFGCKKFYGEPLPNPCVLTVAVTGTPSGCVYPTEGRAKNVKWERCSYV